MVDLSCDGCPVSPEGLRYTRIFTLSLWNLSGLLKNQIDISITRRDSFKRKPPAGRCDGSPLRGYVFSVSFRSPYNKYLHPYHYHLLPQDERDVFPIFT